MMSRFEEYRALDEALDRLVAGEPADAPAEVAGLVGLAFGVREAMAGRDGAVADAAVARPRRHPLAVAAIAAALALTLLTGSAFAASSTSRAGEPLFGVRTAFERLGLAMHRSPRSRAEFEWKIVRERLAELRAAAASGQATDAARAAYEQALARAEGSVNDSDPVLVSEVEEDLNHHVAVLSQLLTTVPARAQPAIQRALQHATDTATRVRSGAVQSGADRGRSHAPRSKTHG